MQRKNSHFYAATLAARGTEKSKKALAYAPNERDHSLIGKASEKDRFFKAAARPQPSAFKRGGI